MASSAASSTSWASLPASAPESLGWSASSSVISGVVPGGAADASADEASACDEDGSAGCAWDPSPAALLLVLALAAGSESRCAVFEEADDVDEDDDDGDVVGMLAVGGWGDEGVVLVVLQAPSAIRHSNTARRAGTLSIDGFLMANRSIDNQRHRWQLVDLRQSVAGTWRQARACAGGRFHGHWRVARIRAPAYHLPGHFR